MGGGSNKSREEYGRLAKGMKKLYAVEPKGALGDKRWTRPEKYAENVGAKFRPHVFPKGVLPELIFPFPV